MIITAWANPPAALPGCASTVAADDGKALAQVRDLCLTGVTECADGRRARALVTRWRMFRPPGGWVAMAYTLVTLADRPDLAEPMRRLSVEAWPEFLRLDAVCGCLWRSPFDSFAGFQLVQCDADDAVAAGPPSRWSGMQPGRPALRERWRLGTGRPAGTTRRCADDPSSHRRRGPGSWIGRRC